MPFRDEREALLRRADALEHDLAEERSARAWSDAQRSRLAEELGQVRRQLARLAPLVTPTPRPSGMNALIGAATAAGLVMAGLVTTLWLARRHPEPTAEWPPVQASPAIPPIPVTPLVPATVPVVPSPPAPPATPQPPPAVTGRLHPTRTEVGDAFRSVVRAVLDCAGGRQGTAMARVTFSGSGTVTAVTIVDSTFGGTPAAACMARALRTMRVDPFENPSLTVTYPYVLR